MRWKVIGGKESGGLLVRKGRKLASEDVGQRLAFGSIVEEIELHGDRLQYKLVDGTGPKIGWVSTSLKDKSLLTPVHAESQVEPVGQPPEQKEREEEDQGELSENEFASIEYVGGPGEVAASQVDEDPQLQAHLKAESHSKELNGSEALYIAKMRDGTSAPRLRILCFPSEGSAGSVFTVRGTELLSWAEQHEIEICAFDYPGRAALARSSPITSVEDLAKDLIAAVLSKLGDGVPYVVWGHSVGTWIAFEFLILCRRSALPMPRACFMMAFPAPHLPPNKRRWSSSANLSEDRLKTELIRWDDLHYTGSGKVALGMPAWMKLMREDRKLFARYVFRHDGEPKFEFPIHAWHFKCEKHNFIDQDMVELWRDWTIGAFETRMVEHLEHTACLYSIDRKKVYFRLVIEAMKAQANLLK